MQLCAADSEAESGSKDLNFLHSVEINLGKREKMVVTGIFSFLYIVFKIFYFPGSLKAGSCDNGWLYWGLTPL